jgi:pyridoxamine 5'-phosphate oxidase
MDPIEKFGRWLAEAEAAGEAEPTAMALATASADGIPSARMVLLKGFDRRGFVFFTNYDSDKAADLRAHPQAALVFRWPVVHRQVRVAGPVAKVTRAESDAYFATRPRGSQLGAWASAQSTVIESREVLERGYHEMEERFVGREIPRPTTWGGYRVRPVTVELWEGRANRLHDRTRFQRAGSRWRIERLSP